MLNVKVFVNVFNCNVNVNAYHYCYILKCLLRIDSIQTTDISNWENWLIKTLQKLLGNSSKNFVIAIVWFVSEMLI